MTSFNNDGSIDPVLLRKETLTGLDEMFSLIVDEQKSNLMGVYLETIEGLITREEEREFSAIEERALTLPAEERNSFYESEIPYWWEEFRTQLRASYIVTVISHLEQSLKYICMATEILSLSRIQVDDLAGAEMQRAKKYMATFASQRIQLPGDDVWLTLQAFYKIRNHLIHRGGIVLALEPDIRILVEANLGLSYHGDRFGGHLELGREFCEYVTKFVREFECDLAQKLRDWQLRTLRIEYGGSS